MNLIRSGSRRYFEGKLPGRAAIVLACVAAVVLFAFLAPGGQSGTSGDPAIALIHATIIDGNGGPPRGGMTIVISGERIVSVFPDGKQKPPPRAQVIDMIGRYLIPGLIDSHVHLISGADEKDAAARVQRFALLGGITSVRDMAGDALALAAAAKAAMNPESPSPRIYFSALMAGPAFFQDPRARASAHGGTAGEVPWLRSITPQTDVSKVIGEAKATGATGIKIYADLPADLITRITDEAHRQGLRVWSHATVFPARPGDAVAAGVDVISHSAYLVWEGASVVPASYRARLSGDYDAVPVESAPITRLLERMRAQGTVLDATLFVFESQARSKQTPPGVRDMGKLVTWSEAVTRRAHDLKVRVVAGTDSIGTPEREKYPNLHEEMRLLAEKCGFTPIEAITAATRTGAEILGIDKDFGTIDTGKIADLVALSADPTADIHNTTKILWVMKSGRVWK
jgi:imidazolonepropionase-like amidohydrolase